MEWSGADETDFLQIAGVAKGVGLGISRDAWPERNFSLNLA
jgi:hypothetical protein